MFFGLCNATASFERCMMVIFSNLIKNIMEVFMDAFSVQEMQLVLNWEKCKLMVREGIVLGHSVRKKHRSGSGKDQGD
jgi:hypothetical protein